MAIRAMKLETVVVPRGGTEVNLKPPMVYFWPRCEAGGYGGASPCYSSWLSERPGCG